jgi:hypothetical protein
MEIDPNAVQPGAENTAPVDSQPTEGTPAVVDQPTTPEPKQTEGTPKVDPSPETPAETTKGQGADDLSDKTNKRIRDLSQDKKDLSDQLSQRDEMLAKRDGELKQLRGQIGVARDPQTQTEQAKQPGYSPELARLNIIEAEQVLNRAENLRVQDQMKYDQAANKHPELDKTSPHYDRNFADLTYHIVQGNPELNYDQAAAQLKAREGLAQKKASIKAEEQVGIKQANSADPATRSPSGHQTAEELAYQRKAEKFQKSGKLADAMELLDY